MTWPADHFEQLYSTPDPYGFTTSWYEQRKRDVTLAALLQQRYRHALEIGCSEGVITERLLSRCDHVTAVDASTTALARARERLAGSSRVTLRDGHLPGQALPPGPYDLVVFSEVGYFLDADDLDAVTHQIDAVSGPGTELVGVHWTRPSDDLPQDGHDVHDRLGRMPLWDVVVQHVETDFRLDVMVRR